MPGLISLLIISAITTFAGLEMGRFRQAHRTVHSIGDAGQLIFGPMGREVLGFFYWLYNALIIGAAIVTFSIALNTLTNHAACSIVWMTVAAAITIVVCTICRTMKYVAPFGWLGMGCLFVAVWLTAIACLAQRRPHKAPSQGPFDLGFQAFATPSFGDAMNAVATHVLSLAGTATFIPIHAEMRRPSDYRKALWAGQGFVVINYTLVGIVIYAKVGQYVASPAIGSAGPTVEKIGYGIALVGLMVSCLFEAHISAKYSFVRILRGSRHLQEGTMVHWLVWFFSILVAVIVGFLIAAGVPFFGDLLGLLGSLFGVLWAMVVPGMTYLYDRDALRRVPRTWREILIALMMLSGFFVIVGGTYGSVSAIKADYDTGSLQSAFVC